MQIMFTEGSAAVNSVVGTETHIRFGAGPGQSSQINFVIAPRAIVLGAKCRTAWRWGIVLQQIPDARLWIICRFIFRAGRSSTGWEAVFRANTRRHRQPHDGGSEARVRVSFFRDLTCLTFRLIFCFFVEVWPTRESFGMARGPRFWALGVDSGPRGGAFEGILDPKIIEHIFFIGAQTAPM